MRKRGRPVLGAFSGLFLGLFLGIDLLIFGVVALDSVVLILLPIVGLVLGIALPLVMRARGGGGGGAGRPSVDDYVHPPTPGTPGTAPSS